MSRIQVAAPSGSLGIQDLDEVASAVLSRKDQRAAQAQYNIETLARWLEIPEPDLPELTPETFDPNVLVQHIVLEHKFREWFNEWGYIVELGEVLRSSDAPELECVTDVYGTLDTIHGMFEVALNFVCDNPPDENRVIALASKLGAYANTRSTFSVNDVFMIVTPWEFTKGAAAAIRFQNRKREYCVLGVDGSVLHDLESAESSAGRLQELQERVRTANLEAEITHHRQP